MLAEQDTVGMRRSERKAMEEMTGKKKMAGTRTPDERLAQLQQEKSVKAEAPPRRQPRPGKPLKR